MNSDRRIRINGLCLTVLIALLVSGTLYYFAGTRSVVGKDSGVVTMPTPIKRALKRPTKRKYSEFPHSQKAHQVACVSCHKFPSENWNKVRQGNAAFPDITEYPKHESCLNCHRQQFFRGRPPVICSICHTNPSPRDSSRHPFPNPREIFDNSPKGRTAVSDFVVSFPHDKHIGIVSGPEKSEPGITAGEESCSTCHKTYQPQGEGSEEFVRPVPAKWGDKFWLKKGTFKTVPMSHETCFTCHSADSGITPAPTDCAVCHKLQPPEMKTDFDPTLAAATKLNDKTMSDAWRRRDSSGTFRHEWMSHAELSCSTCHDVTKMNTVDGLTKKVNLLACATCHATATSDDGGALNFEADARKANAKFECTKCHLTFGKLPIPSSHIKAIAAAAGK